MGSQKGTFYYDYFTMVFIWSFINKLFIVFFFFFIEYFTKAQVKQNTWNQVSAVTLDFLFGADSVGPCSFEQTMFHLLLSNSHLDIPTPFTAALFYHIIISTVGFFCWHIYLSCSHFTSLMSFPQHISISRSGNDYISNPSGTQHRRLSARSDQHPDSPSTPHTSGPWWLLVLSQCLQQHWQPG